MQQTVTRLDKKITDRIDNLIEHNLQIPKLIDDPEMKDENSNAKFQTLKDYILNEIEEDRKVGTQLQVLSQFYLYTYRHLTQHLLS